MNTNTNTEVTEVNKVTQGGAEAIPQIQKTHSHILLVDDDAQALDSMRKILEMEGHDVHVAHDGQEALDLIRLRLAQHEPLHLILTDVRMPRMTGLEFFKALQVMGAPVPVVFMTAFGQIEDAVWAMKTGAVDFLTKPFRRMQLKKAVDSALRRAKNKIQEPIASPSTRLLGGSPRMKELQSVVDQVARADATVLILGESGSGKEQVARAIFERSSRASGPFVVLNCAAIPEQLIEAELFGHERGAFSGATYAKPGLFEVANGGMLFLDEIGDMPLSLQAKLLRVLQEREVRRIGATKSTPLDVRVLAATHRDLKSMVEQKLFREDLYFRLSVVEVKVPALRDRVEDLPILAGHFLREFSTRHRKIMTGFSEGARALLLQHQWPGNVRELSNVMERAVIFAQGSEVAPSDLPSHLADLSTTKQQGRSVTFPIGTPLHEVEDELIKRTLEATSGDKNLAAKLLGVNPRTIYRKLDKFHDTK